ARLLVLGALGLERLLLLLGRFLVRKPRRFLGIALGLLRLRRLAAQLRLCVRQLLLLLGHHLPRLLHLRLLVRRLLLGVRCALQGLLSLILLRARLGFLALLATPEHRAAKRKRDARHPNRSEERRVGKECRDR